MRTLKCEPESINNEEFQGWIELQVPHARDRALVFKTMKFKMNAQGEVIPNDDVAEMMVGMIDVAEKFLVNAEITRKSDGKVFTKEDVFFEPEFNPLISEIGNLVMSGFKPSKK